MAELTRERLASAVVVRAQALARRSRLNRWWFQSFWLFYLLQPAGEVLHQPWPLVGRVALLAGLGVFCVCYLWCCSLWTDREDAPVLRYVAPAAMLVIAVPVAYVAGKSGLYVYVYVGSAAMFALPMTWVRNVIGVMLGVVLVTGLAGAAAWSDIILAMVLTLFISLMVMLARGRAEATEKLREAQETLARLAVNEERLRFARDLHDLLGHSLSLITLKSELAGRFLPANPEAAAREVADIERVSRQALVDVREAVSGYRRPTLEVELARADHALATARIELIDETPPGPSPGRLPPAREAALAWALREAVVNVVRHSQARRCWVRLAQREAEMVLEVADDGRGAGGGDGVPYGNGLSGLYERLTLEGGRLETEAAGQGFVLRAWVPISSAGPTLDLDQPGATVAG